MGSPRPTPTSARDARPLAQAAREIGSPALRNRATVAGNIVTASPANDTLSALLALDATVTLRSVRGARTLPVSEFVTGMRTTALAADELVVDIAIPVTGHAGVFVKLGNRRAQAISIVHVTAVVDLDGGVVTARLAAGSVAPTIVMVDPAPLVGNELTDDAIAAMANAAVDAVTPIDDIRADRRVPKPRPPRHGESPALHALKSGTVAHTPMRQSGTTVVPQRRSETLVNGSRYEAPERATTLLDWLRTDARLTGTKEGCAEGECGACTVHLDGAAVLSCLVPAARAHGADVTTVEGLARRWRTSLRLSAAFVTSCAVQCGFCIPGFLMSGRRCWPRTRPRPTGRDAFAGQPVPLHRLLPLLRLRAGGDVGDRAGRGVAARRRPGQGDRSRPVPGRPQAADALCTPRCSATSPTPGCSRWTTSGRAPSEGVVAVFTAADVPVNEYGLTMFDQPVLVGPDPAPAVRVDATSAGGRPTRSPSSSPIGSNAARGRGPHRGEWEDLPVVADLDAALRPVRARRAPESAPTRTCTYRCARATSDRAGPPPTSWSRAPTSSPTRSTPTSSRRPGSPTSTTTVASPSRIAGQWTHEDQEQIADALDLRRAGAGDLPGHRRRVRRAGGHVAPDRALALARVAPRRAGRAWSAASGPREESIVGHHKRHRGRIQSRWGAAATARWWSPRPRPPRRRRVQLHDQQGAGEPPPDVSRPVRDPEPCGIDGGRATPTPCPVARSAASARRRRRSWPRRR